MKAVLSTHGLVKRFRGVKASDGIDFELRPGEIHAVIGPNGAGKSTFVSQLAGEITPDEGRILLDGEDITHAPVHRRASLGIARSYQITAVFEELTVLENVMLAVQARSGHGFRFIRAAANETAIERQARDALAAVGLETLSERTVADLAHGVKRQIELAIVTAMLPRVLLLDEPMAGTSALESREMIDLLRKLRKDSAIVLVEHDLEAVFALADRISVLVYGRVIATGSVDDIRQSDEVRKAYIGESEDAL